MAASKNDKLMKVGGAPGTASTLSAPGYTAGDTSINVGSTANWSTDTGITFCIDTVSIVDGKEVRDAGSYNEYVGTVATGTQITNVQWVAGTGDRNYTAGATTRVYIGVTANRENRIVEWGTAEHNQDGTHSNVTAASLTTSGNVTIGGTLTIGGSGSGGWDAASGSISAVTYNGNRSYDLTTSNDNTALISPGMRLRTTRTVAAPTQSTSLNGTTQYWSKSSPVGMTFTDDFAAGRWIKLTSYAAGEMTIESRFNGSNGWKFGINAAGQLFMAGFNGVGNQSYVQSYQSVPLNKWVHVAAQLDMSAFTATTTTSYTMFDGVDVPALVGRTGTNPTSLVQAGNYEVGSQNGGTNSFPGKLASGGIFSAKVTQATMRGYISQGLAGTETSLVSAYSFNGVATDLNTTNANNLTANGSAVATNADSPFGGQAGGTISSTLDYGIVQKVTASTLTIQVAEGCTIPTSGGVASASYSALKMPFGFPGDDEKWRIKTLINSQYDTGSIAPTVIAPYTGVKINIPVGKYRVGFEALVQTNCSSGTAANASHGLSSTTTAISEPELIGNVGAGSNTSFASISGTITRKKTLEFATPTDYYMVSKNLTPVNATSYMSVTNYGGISTIFAENPYL